MSASINDKLTNTSSGVRPVSTTVSTLRNTGATTLACADLTGWPTDTAVHFVTYSLDGNGDVVAGSQTDWKGIVSGSSINNLTVTGGSDAGNAVNDIVELLPTAAWGKDTFTGLTASLNQLDGSLKDNVVTTAKINDSAVTTAKLNDASVTPAKRTGGYFIGVITAASTLNTTGNKAITGVGFTPKFVRFQILPGGNSATSSMGFGSMTASSQMATWISTTASGGTRQSYTNRCIAWGSQGNTTAVLECSYVSMDSNGFTINVNTASSTFDVGYEAYA